MRARNVVSLTPAAVVAALDHAGSPITSPLSAIFTHHVHGAATRVPLASTAVGSRSPHQVIEVVATWEANDDGVAQHTAWADDVSAALAPSRCPAATSTSSGPTLPTRYRTGTAPTRPPARDRSVGRTPGVDQSNKAETTLQGWRGRKLTALCTKLKPVELGVASAPTRVRATTTAKSCTVTHS